MAIPLCQIEHKKKEKLAKRSIINRFLVFEYVSELVLDIKISNFV